MTLIAQTIQKSGNKFLASTRQLLQFEWARYLLVGGTATITDWSLYYYGVYVLKIPYPVSLAIAFGTSACLNFMLSKIFTFKNESKKVFRQFLLFMATGLLSYSLNLTLISILLNILNFGHMSARIVSTLLLLLFNYGSAKFIIFKKTHPQ